MPRTPDLNGGTLLQKAQLNAASALVAVHQGGVTYPMRVEDLLDTGALAAGAMYIDPRSYGAKFNAAYVTDGVITNGDTFASASYSFPPDLVGTTVWINGANARTVTAVDIVGGRGVLRFTPTATNGTARTALVGNDDTAAIKAAFDAAEIYSVFVGLGTTQDNASSFPFPVGGVVVLPAGRACLVSNSQADFDAGKTACIEVPRRCGLVGAGGPYSSHIYLAPGTVGHGVNNKGMSASSWDDFIIMRNFSIFCNGGWSPGQLDGLRYHVAFNNYAKVDVFTRIQAVMVFDSNRDGFYISGRGENIYEDLVAVWPNRHGFFIDGTMDSRFTYCMSSGAKRAGIRINKSANIHMTNCKSFYSGASGGSVPSDCVNWWITADQARNGLVFLTTCEGQESRGSSFLIESGYNIFNGCIATDPSRAGLTGGALPTVRAGFEVRQGSGDQSGCHPIANTFIGCVTGPSVGIFAAQPHGGTHALFINGGSTTGNRGDIYTFPGAVYQDSGGVTTDGSNGTAGAKVGGNASNNATNTLLQIDRVALT